jgi:hypothetical protein
MVNVIGRIHNGAQITEYFEGQESEFEAAISVIEEPGKIEAQRHQLKLQAIDLAWQYAHDKGFNRDKFSWLTNKKFVLKENNETAILTKIEAVEAWVDSIFIWKCDFQFQASIEVGVYPVIDYSDCGEPPHTWTEIATDLYLAGMV